MLYWINSCCNGATMMLTLKKNLERKDTTKSQCFCFVFSHKKYFECWVFTLVFTLHDHVATPGSVRLRWICTKQLMGSNLGYHWIRPPFNFFVETCFCNRNPASPAVYSLGSRGHLATQLTALKPGKTLQLALPHVTEWETLLCWQTV